MTDQQTIIRETQTKECLTDETQSTPNLAELLRRAAQRKMTPAEIEAQRRSFVRAEAGFGSDADEAAYRSALDRGDEAELRRLRREADERVRRAEEIIDGE